jgi:phosphohistidine phosphatase SixA
MALHLVRHAEAGARPAWDGPDDLRPLVGAGVVQAGDLAAVLAEQPVKRVLSSGYVRCLQTVAPLADRFDLPVEAHPALSEEASIEDSWALLEELAGTDAVLCSHGNVIGSLLDRLHRRGVELVAAEWSCRKGSVWSLTVGPDGSFLRCHLLVDGA